MSDYIPDPRRPENNKFGYDETTADSGRSGFALIALLGIAAVIGGFLYFGGPKPADQQAQMPPATPQTAPANPDAVPAAPLAPRPAPATPRQQ